MPTVIALSDLHSNPAVLTRLRKVQAQYPDAITIFLGDYIDTLTTNTGFAVPEAIQAMVAADPAHVFALRGNHEQGLLDYMADETKKAWLSYGGKETLAAVSGAGPAASPATMRAAVLAQRQPLLTWLGQLPAGKIIDQLVFVHAGLDFTKADPLTMTSLQECLWVRAKYWFAPGHFGVFAHNPLAHTIVTGHTPNGMVTGEYFNQSRPEKNQSLRNPIYTIAYPGEMPRVLLDGGVGSGDPALLGNIGVFDSLTGQLIDAFED